MIDSAILFIFFVIFALAAILLISSIMTNRAARKIVEIFCRNNALEPRAAKNPDELGLTPPGFVERMMKPRDYKPYALRILKERGVVSETRDGRLYMKQEKLVGNWRCRNFRAQSGIFIRDAQTGR